MLHATKMTKSTDIQDFGVLAIANAVVIQAAEDYRKLRSGELSDGCLPHLGTRKSLEEFFTSTWGMMLSRDMGGYILDKLKKEFA